MICTEILKYYSQKVSISDIKILELIVNSISQCKFEIKFY